MSRVTTEFGTVNRPKSGKTTFHRDGSVTLWDVYTQTWARHDRFSNRVLASLDSDERERVIRHLEMDDS
jgi:hypothetical protein